MQIEQIKISDLKLAEYNPRQIDDYQLNRLIECIKEYGIVEAIVINQDNTVIGGHQRIKACQILGIETIPCYRVNLPKDKEKILNIALNKISGDWDKRKLRAIFEELRIEPIDIEMTGFDEEEINDLLGLKFEEPKEDFTADELANQIKEPISKYGEVYQLGRHRLMCGDSTKQEDLDKLMDGQKADVVFTDPPFNLDYEPDTERYHGFMNDGLSETDWALFMDRFFENIDYVLKPKGSIYLWIDWRQYHNFKLRFDKYWRQHALIIWDKLHFGRGEYFRFQHEVCLFGSKGEKPNIWNGRNRLGDLIDYEWPQGDIWKSQRDALYDHPTQKPLRLADIGIKASSHKGSLVVDLFGGSGCTLLAAERIGRTCYMMELDPVFCDVIRKRYEGLYGH